MKKILLFIILSGFCVLLNAADPWAGFFKPVNREMVSTKAAGTNLWLFRPAIEISAIQLIYDKDLKQFNSSSLQSAGMGIGYQHFIDVNGKPYNNFGFNALVLLDMVPTETSSTAVSFAGTVTALKFISMGAGYNIGIKKFFLLTGITYNFN